mgnify:CR=1 FL=1
MPGQWLVRAEWNWIWGLELYGLNMQAAHTRAINNTVRVGTGLTLWNNGPGMIAYGNIIFEDKSTNETMHNIYTQNEYDNYGYKYFVRNVSLESSKNGCSSGSQDCYSFHAYATADTVSGYDMLENVIAPNRFLIGGYGVPTDHVVLRNNYLYQSDMQLGYSRPLQAEVRNNYCARSGLMFEWLWGAGEVRHIQKAPTLFYDNTFLTSGTGDVVEPDDGIVAIGSGGPYALAAARALSRHTGMTAKEIAMEALKTSAEICIYTNSEITVEEL